METRKSSPSATTSMAKPVATENAWPNFEYRSVTMPDGMSTSDQTTIDLVKYFLKVDLSEANPKLIDPFLARVAATSTSHR